MRYLEVIVIPASKQYLDRVCYWNHKPTPGMEALIATKTLNVVLQQQALKGSKNCCIMNDVIRLFENCLITNN